MAVGNSHDRKTCFASPLLLADTCTVIMPKRTDTQLAPILVHLFKSAFDTRVVDTHPITLCISDGAAQQGRTGALCAEVNV